MCEKRRAWGRQSVREGGRLPRWAEERWRRARFGGVERERERASGQEEGWSRKKHSAAEPPPTRTRKVRERSEGRGEPRSPRALTSKCTRLSPRGKTAGSRGMTVRECGSQT